MAFINYRKVLFATVLMLLLFCFQNCSNQLAGSLNPSSTSEQIDYSKTFTNENSQSITGYGCNAVAFGHHSSLGNKFVGRLLNNTDTNNPCSGTAWSLVLTEMDWSTNTMSLKKRILDTRTPVSFDNGMKEISSAYDPTVIQWKGEIWVAFECAGSGIVAVGACVGPLKNDFTIDTSRISLVINGIWENPTSFIAASVPKLVVHKERVYLYWSVTDLKTLAPFSFVNSRGVELINESAGPRRLWVKKVDGQPAGNPILVNDSLTVEVQSLGNDSRSNRIADLSGVISDGENLYATSQLGGGTCIDPDSASEGCYRLAISKTEDPLRYQTFNSFLVQEDFLPPNPSAYYRFVYRPEDGATVVMGGWFYNPAGLSNAPMYMRAFKWPEKLIKPICDPNSKLWPNWGEKNGACLASCGGIGGTAAFADACENHGMTSAGDSYDSNYCCK